MAYQLLPFLAEELLSVQTTIGPHWVVLYRDCWVLSSVLSFLLFKPVFLVCHRCCFIALGHTVKVLMRKFQRMSCSLSLAEGRWQVATVFLLKPSNSLSCCWALIILWNVWTKQQMIVISKALITFIMFFPLQIAWQLSVLIFHYSEKA